jgi:predicted transcriptional regulator
MSTTRDRILDALRDLPPDATFDDAIERLVFLAKIDAGLAELDEGKGIPHTEVKRQLGV